MKKVFLAALLFISATAKAQSIYFEIEPYVINKVIVSGGTSYVSKSDTATAVSVAICGIGDSACINYYLYKSDRTMIESGIKSVPLQAISSLTDRPISMDAVNVFFAYWRIEAIEQLFNFR